MRHLLIVTVGLCLAACEEKRPAQPAPKPAPPAATAPTSPPPPAPETKPAPTAAPDGVLKRTETDSGLIIEDLKFGDGDEVKPHANVLMHYKGTLADGTEFDNSYKRGAPLPFSLDGVIKGWQEGVPGMKVGGKRRIIVPPELGYGKRGFKGPNGQVVVPPDALLIFEMELVEVRK